MNAIARDIFPLRQITAGQLLARNFPPREFAIDPWLRTGESALVWAATGVGKTWLTLSLALAMAGGGKVWEWSSPKPRKVLLIDGEMNVQDLQERMRKLIDDGGVDQLDREALRSNLILMPRQHQHPKATFYDIADLGAQQRVLDKMTDEGAEVVIVDNLTTCADGLSDENDATAFRSIMGFLLMMKQAGKTAILVHHANKSGTDARGSTALEATFEVKLGLRRPKVSKPDTASFIAEFGKLRTKGADSVSRPRVWTLGADGWAVEDDEDTADERVIAALETVRYVNQQELAKALGMSQPTISRALKKASVTGRKRKEEIDRLFIEARTLRRADANPFADPDDASEDNPDF